MQSILNYDFKGKKALLRVDYNVPLDANFNVTDDSRISATVNTIQTIIKGGGSVIIMSHFGRPKGVEDKYSLRHIISSVEKNIGMKVKFATDSIGESAKSEASSLEAGEVLLLENVRFYEQEQKGDEQFAYQLSLLGDCFVFDAFGAAHRVGASTTVIAKFFPDDKMFGYVMERELDATKRVLDAPEHPYIAIIGGAKVSSKITVIENLMDKVDKIIIGGGMAYTFAAANGGEIGNSLCEKDQFDTAHRIISKSKEKGVELFLSCDSICGDSFSSDANVLVCQSDEIPTGWIGMDIGPIGAELFSKAIEGCKTILWNGPMGVFEMDKFAEGSKIIAKSIVAETKNGAFSLIGGGDSVACINKFGYENDVSYCSTGGGALLEYLEGKTLPAIAAIMN